VGQVEERVIVKGFRAGSMNWIYGLTKLNQDILGLIGRAIEALERTTGMSRERKGTDGFNMHYRFRKCMGRLKSW
jgi:hypothetical protein